MESFNDIRMDFLDMFQRSGEGSWKFPWLLNLKGPQKSPGGERPSVGTREDGCPGLRDQALLLGGAQSFDQMCACVSLFLIVNQSLHFHPRFQIKFDLTSMKTSLKTLKPEICLE